MPRSRSTSVTVRFAAGLGATLLGAVIVCPNNTPFQNAKAVPTARITIVAVIASTSLSMKSPTAQCSDHGLV